MRKTRNIYGLKNVFIPLAYKLSSTLIQCQNSCMRHSHLVGIGQRKISSERWKTTAIASHRGEQFIWRTAKNTNRRESSVYCVCVCVFIGPERDGETAKKSSSIYTSFYTCHGIKRERRLRAHRALFAPPRGRYLASWKIVNDKSFLRV